MNQTELSSALEINESEALLLRRFAEAGDGEAFSQLTRRYAGLVYGTCLRVTGDAHQAADAAQETFFHLLKNARAVSGSLASWLYCVATRRSVDLIRNESARRRREQAYAAQPREVQAWADVAPHVDTALRELPPEERELLVLHFLQGQTMSSLAAARGISQPTVSRRIQQALEALRSRLRQQGLLVGAGLLAGGLSQTAQAVPAVVLQQLGRMALAGPGLAGGQAASTLAKTLNWKLAAGMAVLVGVGAWLASRAPSPEPPSPAPLPAALPTVPSNSALTPPRPRPVESAPNPAPTVAKPQLAAPAPVEAAPPPPDATIAPPAPAAPARVANGGWTGGPGNTRWGIPSATKPEGAVWRFVMALPQSPERLEATFVPNAPELAKFRQVLLAPRTEEEKEIAVALHSIGIPVQVLQTNATPAGLRVRWRAYVRNEFVATEEGQPRSWRVGESFEMETLLQQVGPEWRVAGF